MQYGRSLHEVWTSAYYVQNVHKRWGSFAMLAFLEIGRLVDSRRETWLRAYSRFRNHSYVRVALVALRLLSGFRICATEVNDGIWRGLVGLGPLASHDF